MSPSINKILLIGLFCLFLIFFAGTNVAKAAPVLSVSTTFISAYCDGSFCPSQTFWFYNQGDEAMIANVSDNAMWMSQAIEWPGNVLGPDAYPFVGSRVSVSFSARNALISPNTNTGKITVTCYNQSFRSCGFASVLVDLTVARPTISASPVSCTRPSTGKPCGGFIIPGDKLSVTFNPVNFYKVAGPIFVRTSAKNPYNLVMPHIYPGGAGWYEGGIYRHDDAKCDEGNVYYSLPLRCSRTVPPDLSSFSWGGNICTTGLSAIDNTVWDDFGGSHLVVGQTGTTGMYTPNYACTYVDPGLSDLSLSYGVPTNCSCGTSDGGSFLNAPASNLCNPGTPSAVAQNGSFWEWSCTDPFGGNPAYCSANVISNATANIWADSTNLPNPNTGTTVHWTYSNATSCSLDPSSVLGTITIPPNSGSGNKATGSISAPGRNFSITCSPGPVTSSVYVNVAALLKNLVVIKAGQGTVTSNPSGVNCGTTCQSQYAPGTSIKLTETPNPGRIFTGWSGITCAGTGETQRTPTCTFIMPANDVTVVASFAVDPNYKEF